MSHALMMMLQSPSCFAAVRAAKKRSPPPPPRKKTQRQSPATTTTSHGFGGEKKTPVWQCVENCGACCKLDKGPTFPSAEEIFDDPSDVELYNGLVGEDDRPYFCRVEPEIFDALYGIDKKSFNKEACSCCTDTIKAVYGANSQESERFNRAIWSSSSK